MRYSGKVHNGVVVLEPGEAPPEGADVSVFFEDSPAAGEKPVSELGEFLLGFSGIAKSLPDDMSENHDKYLYGAKKP